MLRSWKTRIALALASLGLMLLSPLSSSATTQTVNFTSPAPPVPVNGPLNGVYPSGVINWGTNVWYLSGPWGPLTGNSTSFANQNQTSGTFNFLISGGARLVSLDAYNGDTGPSTVTLSCPGQPNTVQQQLAAGQLATISTGWSSSCTSVTVTSSNGWWTNFTNIVYATGGPVLSNVQSSSVGSNRATITWTSGVPATSQVEYGTTSSYGQETPLDSTLVTSHSVVLNNLQPATAYHYRVKSQDASGNLSASADFTFSTLLNGAVLVSFNDLTLTQPNQPLTGQYPAGLVDWGTNQWTLSSPWGPLTGNSISYPDATTTSAGLTFLTPGRPLSIDAYNGGTAATMLTFTCGTGPLNVQRSLPAGQLTTIVFGWTGTCPSLRIASTNGFWTNFTNLVFDGGVGPVISNVQTSAVDFFSATVSWTTNGSGTSQVEYGRTTAYGQTTTLNASQVTSHSVSLSNLQVGSVYHYRVYSQDAAGNLARSIDYTFTTTSALCLPAAQAANPVACENTLQGNPQSDWQIAMPADGTIQGFTTDISVNKGGTINFKIQTPASAYTITIYRLGYYGGQGARRIASINPSAPLPQNQPACLTQAASGLIDCGNWAVSASWSVPSTAVSGVYIAKLVRPDTGAANVIPFVVRDDASTSDILFRTSDTTWQAYNTYGGNSLYNGGPGTNPARAYKVSYNRPWNNTVDPDVSNWIFYTEYPMLRFLEANGYNVSYSTSLDADRQGSLIRNHKMYMMVGHDEYWSGAERANIEAARNAGVHLGFFSGNAGFWKTRWENSIDGTNTPYRSLVCYKETHANAVIDPADPPIWTGTWRDPRFSPPADGGKPENALNGTIFWANGVREDSIQVPAAYGKMRLWRNTSLANLAPGEVATFQAGTLGWEWDIDRDNGFRPAGLAHFSEATVSMQFEYLLDNGSNYGAGTATHNLTLYRHPSGALVFSAGTVQWSWGLDATHDPSPFLTTQVTPDVRIQQATVNILADMGFQPQTLMTGLVAASASTNRTPPTSVITSPTNGQTLQLNQPLTVSGTASAVNGGVVAGVDISVDGGATWHPATGRDSWTYTFTPTAFGSYGIKTRAVDDSANLETPSAGITVSIPLGVTCPCTLWPATASPTSAAGTDASSVEVGVQFKSDANGYITGIRFYKGAGNTGTHVGSLWSPTGALLAQATFTTETASGWQQVTFANLVAITANTVYTASYHAPAGHYADDRNFFTTTSVDRMPLHAPATGAVTPGNGVYVYGSTSAFPNQTFQASNYWVDVVFTT